MAPEERHAWDRQQGESTKGYAAFRLFRDMGPMRKLADVDVVGTTSRTVRQWSYDHDWWARAAAWDDLVHMEEDRQRLEDLREMHDTHQRAGRMALTLAMEAMAKIQPEDITPTAAAKLLDLGARLERDILTVSVEDLQGIGKSADDPFEAIARELTADQPAP